MRSDRDLILELLERERGSLNHFIKVVENGPQDFANDPDIAERVGEWQGRVLHCERLIIWYSCSEPNILQFQPIDYDIIDGTITFAPGAPFDGKPVLIKTNTGIVEAWWCPAESHETMEGTEYSGFCWVCYDDAFQLELDDAKGWMPLPI